MTANNETHRCYEGVWPVPCDERCPERNPWSTEAVDNRLERLQPATHSPLMEAS